jgi:hypothetical protein
VLIAGQEKGQGWVRFLHGARLTGNLLTLGQIRHPTIKKNDYYPLIARAVGLTGAPGSSPGGLRAGAQSRRAIALQPVRADPPVVSALDPPMPASVPPPASAPLPVPVPRSQRRLRCSRRLRASRVRLRPLLSRRCSRQHLSRRPPRPRTRNQAVPIGPLFAATRLPAHLYSPARRPATQSRSFRLPASHLAISPHPVAYWAVG